MHCSSGRIAEPRAAFTREKRVFLAPIVAHAQPGRVRAGDARRRRSAAGV